MKTRCVKDATGKCGTTNLVQHGGTWLNRAGELFFGVVGGTAAQRLL